MANILLLLKTLKKHHQWLRLCQQSVRPMINRPSYTVPSAWKGMQPTTLSLRASFTLRVISVQGSCLLCSATSARFLPALRSYATSSHRPNLMAGLSFLSLFVCLLRKRFYIHRLSVCWMIRNTCFQKGSNHRNI